MIVNRYPGKCESCGSALAQGDGFAYKNGYKWFSVCKSAACHRRLGLNAPMPEAKQERKIAEDGLITMPYDRDAVPLIKSLPGARWNPETKQWKVSVDPKDLPRVLEVADQVQLEVPAVLRELVAAGTSDSIEALDRAERTRVDGKTLFPFQKKGVEFLALHDRALLADDMGLGKTVQSLVALPENERVIVISPAAVKYNWADEIKMWRPDYKTHICSGKDSFRLPERGEVVIVNYDILPAWLSPTKDSGKRTQKGDVIKVANLTNEQAEILNETTLIADEAHLVKNYKAARSQKVTQLARACKRVWFMTGTPLMNRPQDLFGVLQSGDMHPLGNWYKFVQLFNGYKNNWGGYEFGMPSPEVPEKMKRVMLRRLKTEVLKDLPPKTYQKIEVNDLSKALVQRLNDFIVASAVHEGLIAADDVTSELIKDAEKVRALSSKLEMTSLPSFEQFSEIRALLAEARIPAMLEEVESYEESGTPLIVFSAHKAPIKQLAGRDGWATITGDTDPEERRNIVRSFQEGKLKGVGLTIQAGGVGLTLTRASNALFVDLDWTPALNIQAEDRICRIGQTSNSVLIKRMSSTHPLDRHMQMLIEHKMELAFKALEASIKFTPLKERPQVQDLEIIEESDDELAARIKDAEFAATREIALGKLQAVAGREAAKVNDVPEPKLTPKRKQMLREALDYMVAQCDGAHEKDGRGFNKPDAAIMHWVHDTGLQDTDEVVFRLVERVLVRYRRQLKSNFESIWKPDL